MRTIQLMTVIAGICQGFVFQGRRPHQQWQHRQHRQQHKHLFCGGGNNEEQKQYCPYKSSSYYDEYLRRLNSRNATLQNSAINIDEGFFRQNENGTIIIQTSKIITLVNEYNKVFQIEETDNDDDDDDEEVIDIGSEQYAANNNHRHKKKKSEIHKSSPFYKRRNSASKKSENFEVVETSPIQFCDIGGYENVKEELMQCVDLLTNYTKYAKYNVRTPKGIILEGPPGNGKTMLAKGFAGEAGCAFIAVSGSEFQDKYVGVGGSRVRELFKLAEQNKPCIIFIDEIDAIGRKRSSGDDGASSERDSTLNELLVSLDGFKSCSGVFLIAATNRVDLLDEALTRPSRIDKKIFIGLPDTKTRRAILDIHLKGKPYNKAAISVDGLVDTTAGLSGSQIENLLNEAMLNALRTDRETIEQHDLEMIQNKIMAGWQPTEHEMTDDLKKRIAIHEMGHAIAAYFALYHPPLVKVVINLNSPNSPGYTTFEQELTAIQTREALFEHLTILLGGRIAEELFFGLSITTGALNDFERAFQLAKQMVVQYGMGTQLLFAHENASDKYREMVDDEVAGLIGHAYSHCKTLLSQYKPAINAGAEILLKDKVLIREQFGDLIAGLAVAAVA